MHKTKPHTHTQTKPHTNKQTNILTDRAIDHLMRKSAWGNYDHIQDLFRPLEKQYYTKVCADDHTSNNDWLFLIY